MLEADVQQLAVLGNPLAVRHVELRLAERRGALVLHDLHLHPRADHLFPFLDLRRAADVQAYGGVELEGPAARRRLRVAEHHSNLFTNLIDEHKARFRFRNNAC